MPIFNVETTISDTPCKYQINIPEKNSKSIFLILKEEKHMQYFILKLHAYKLALDQSEEDRTDQGNFIDMSLGEVQEQADEFILPITGDIGNILNALKCTKIINQKDYDYIKTKGDFDNKTVQTSSFSKFFLSIQPTHNTIVPTPDDVISQLQKDPQLWLSLKDNPEVVTKAGNMLETAFKSNPESLPLVGPIKS